MTTNDKEMGGQAQATSTETLNEQQLAEQSGVPLQRVIEFARQRGFRKQGDAYVIPASALPEIQAWAKEHGYLVVT